MTASPPSPRRRLRRRFGVLSKTVAFLALTGHPDAASSSSLPSDDPRSDDDRRGRCLPAEAVTDRLDHALDRPTRVLTSVRIPGTASTKLNQDVKVIKRSSERFRSFLAEEGCEALCFRSDRNDGDDSAHAHAPPVDPFVEFTGEMEGRHITYDTKFKDDEGDIDAFLLTQIRDPIQYARKFYTARGMFDMERKFPEDITFEEWIEMAPWRTNQMTRMLGRENMDQRLIPGNDLIVSPKDHADTYMQLQNKLGEESEILAKAWERLSTRFAWFGLFHRLPESYELLAFTFCTSKDWGDRGATDSDKLKYRGMEILEFMRKRREGGLDPKKGATRKKLEEIHAKLVEINALDVILLRRAEELFDARIREMREMKQRGVKCKFMGEVEVTCAREAEALGTDGISHFDLFH